MIKITVDASKKYDCIIEKGDYTINEINKDDKEVIDMMIDINLKIQLILIHLCHHIFQGRP